MALVRCIRSSRACTRRRNFQHCRRKGKRWRSANARSNRRVAASARSSGSAPQRTRPWRRRKLLSRPAPRRSSLRRGRGSRPRWRRHRTNQVRRSETSSHRRRRPPSARPPLLSSRHFPRFRLPSFPHRLRARSRRCRRSRRTRPSEGRRSRCQPECADGAVACSLSRRAHFSLRISRSRSTPQESCPPRGRRSERGLSARSHRA